MYMLKFVYIMYAYIYIHVCMHVLYLRFILKRLMLTCVCAHTHTHCLILRKLKLPHGIPWNIIQFKTTYLPFSSKENFIVIVFHFSNKWIIQFTIISLFMYSNIDCITTRSPLFICVGTTESNITSTCLVLVLAWNIDIALSI